MKSFYKMVIAVVALLSVASMGFADTYNDHVRVAANGKGDLLVYPFYVAANGWQSQIDLVNTSSRSVVARLSVKSYAYSNEVLDFLVYLSPYDMWRGTLMVNSTYGSQPIMYSTDSSAPSSNSSVSYFATSTNPMAQPLSTDICAGDSNQLGYVVVVEAWSGNVAFAAGITKEQRGQAIRAAYESTAGGYLKTDTVDALHGNMVVSFPAGGWLASRDAVAFANYKNQAKLFTAGGATPIGVSAYNSVQEIDAALAKKTLALPYDQNSTASTIQVSTFPTKQTATTDCKTFTYQSPFFPVSGSVVLQSGDVKQYDNEEQTSASSPFSPGGTTVKLPNEVNFLAIAPTFSFGWIQYTFTETTANFNYSGQPLNYTGAPVIPTVVKILGGLMTLTNGAWDDGVVSGVVGGVPVVLNGYQYSSSYAPTTN